MSKSKSSLLLPIAAAALVGALVSFAVTSGMQAGSQADAPAASIGLESMQKAMDALEARVRSAEQDAAQGRDALAAMEKELRVAVASNASGLNAQGATLSRIEQLQTATNASVQKMEANYKAFNGRIEGNYTSLKQVSKRLDALEGK
jgi:mannitol-specific phosphotransferase system IIBC component